MSSLSTELVFPVISQLVKRLVKVVYLQLKEEQNCDCFSFGLLLYYIVPVPYDSVQFVGFILELVLLCLYRSTFPLHNL